MSARERAERNLGRGYPGSRTPWAALYAGRAVGYALLDVADAIREVATEHRRANDIADAREKRLKRSPKAKK